MADRSAITGIGNEDELARLLDEVSRITDGLGNINSLIVEMTPRPAVQRHIEPGASADGLISELVRRLDLAEMNGAGLVLVPTGTLARVVRALHSGKEA